MFRDIFLYMYELYKFYIIIKPAASNQQPSAATMGACEKPFQLHGGGGVYHCGPELGLPTVCRYVRVSYRRNIWNKETLVSQYNIHYETISMLSPSAKGVAIHMSMQVGTE